MSERQSAKIDLLDEYIVGLMRLLPEDLKVQVRALNRRPIGIEHHISCARLHIQQALADLESLDQETQKLRGDIAAVMDMAQLARLIGPIVNILHGPGEEAGGMSAGQEGQ